MSHLVIDRRTATEAAPEGHSSIQPCGRPDSALLHPQKEITYV